MNMSSQTKDEAAQELTKMIHQYANGVATIEEVDTARDAYAQAYADAALEIERNTIIVQEANHDEGQYEEEADTLGMLEAIVHKGRYIEYMDGKQALLVWRTPTGRLTYQIDLVHVTRAEVEALLGEGKEEKE